jgi:hypothetical protein
VVRAEGAGMGGRCLLVKDSGCCPELGNGADAEEEPVQPRIVIIIAPL